ncbi:DUF4253 domain-containing protein [Kitasatospora sp. NPDC001664]
MMADLVAEVGGLLPPGEFVDGVDGGDGPVLWVSAGPTTVSRWGRMLEEHPRSGLWPLLLDTEVPGETGRRPWNDGELRPGTASRPDLYDPGRLMARWWDEHLAEEAYPGTTAPFGAVWPGPAPRGARRESPEEAATAVAREVLARRPHCPLGLVAAESGAEALALLGWDGVADREDDTGAYAAVLASWEDRFGARLVSADASELVVSVAAPPPTEQAALRVAAEHFAFCPDNLWQGSEGTLPRYAATLVNSRTWTFWWDRWR